MSAAGILISEFVVSIRPRPEPMPAIYEPGRCACCDCEIWVLRNARELIERDHCAAACVVCALRGGPAR